MGGVEICTDVGLLGTLIGTAVVEAVGAAAPFESAGEATFFPLALIRFCTLSTTLVLSLG
jgi:hypothetical protein